MAVAEEEEEVEVPSPPIFILHFAGEGGVESRSCIYDLQRFGKGEERGAGGGGGGGGGGRGGGGGGGTGGRGG